MAPTTRAAKTTSMSKKPTTKNSEDRVVKRPARGFHRFRNGILNVTPKGDEKELVKNNQDAPLMRLPPEIRCRIWEYVLTGKTLRSVRLDLKGGRTVDWMIPPMSERTHGMDLLRTCRQIYTETALLPYKSNTFTFAYYRMIEIDLRYLKTFQRAEITKIQVQVTDMAGLDIEIINQEKIGSLATVARHRLPGLPALKQIHILLFSEVEMGFDATVCEANIRRQLDVLLAGREIDIVFEVASTSWEWHSLM